MRTHSAKGFSLLELLLVVVIIGIVAVAGGTWMQSPIPAAVKSATANLTGVLRNAQTLAISSGQLVYLQPTGVGTSSPGLEWGFCTVDGSGTVSRVAPVQGAWTLNPSDTRYVALGGASLLSSVISGGAKTPAEVTAITAHVQNASIWDRTFFTSGDATYYFMGSGAISQELFIGVAGARSGSLFSNGNRLGLVVVSPTSGISTYLKQDPGAATPAWSRL